MGEGERGEGKDWLLPCTHCGSDDVSGSHEQRADGSTYYFVECHVCEASGPTAGTEQWSVTLWNRRAEPGDLSALRAERDEAQAQLDSLLNAAMRFRNIGPGWWETAIGAKTGGLATFPTQEECAEHIREIVARDLASAAGLAKPEGATP